MPDLLPSRRGCRSSELGLVLRFVLNNVDQSLKHCVVSSVEPCAVHARSGPVAFHIAATRILRAQGDLAHNVNTGLLSLRLEHFDAEDVVECVFVVRNVLRFLNFGDPVHDRSPPALMDSLFETFLGCSNSQFRNCVRNLHDFHRHAVAQPEDLLLSAQDCCAQIVSKPGNEWLKIKKSRAAFHSETRTQDPAPAPAPTPAPSPSPAPAQGSCSRRQRVVDRVPPGKGEPHTRVNSQTGREEHWCSACPDGGRWGNHLTSGHAEWLVEFRASQRRREEQRAAREAETQSPSAATQGPNTSGDDSSPTETSQGPSSMRRSAAAVAPLTNMLRRTCVSFQDSDSDSDSS